MIVGEGAEQEESRLVKERFLTSGETTVVVLPQDGAILSRFRVGETDVFMPDQIFQTDKGSKRRGGCPILFPNAGPLTEISSLFSLAQHGFARTLPWKVITYDGRQTVLELQANDETRKHFPFEFGIGLKIEAREGLLKYQMVIVNRSDQTPMPIAPGLHPYFLVPIETKPDIQTNILGFDPRAYDWKTPLILPDKKSLKSKFQDRA